MRRIFKLAFMVGIAFLWIPRVASQDTNSSKDDDNRIFFMVYDENENKIVQVTDITRQVRFHDPKAPRFVLTDSKGTFSLGIGATVRTELNYDFGGIVDNKDFYPSKISRPGEGNYNKNQFQLDATGSSIYVKLVGKTKRFGDILVYVNGYFRGSGNSLKMHHAYVSILGFTAGYDYGTFTDAAAAPATVDFEGPAGQVLYRTTQLRYARSFKNFSFGVGIEVPEVNATETENFAINTQRAPDFPAYVQYNWGGSCHFRLAGILRTMTYSSNINKKAYTETGWGVQGSTTFNPTQKLKILGQITYGKGIGHFFNDLGGLNIDLVPDQEEAGKMQILPMMGWYAGLQYNFTPNVFASGTYSQARVHTENNYPVTGSDTYRYGQYLAINTFWKVSPTLQLGAEYLRGWRTDFNSETNKANRASLLVQYSF
ncbi:DcaP family trimeric outer membrane transporter [Bacteroides sp. 51]|uniref:DcaP family trimeric outer membrane transporter n=1 Tax=Bacteroides sp. 51 TaxID=2302938 RepID=UPI0013D727F1|nr:DcaP family trimeric outer membrane transporter [Bacteroides sp. 51]NDV83323.1 hypothetical protein [Bacteroides sp. 51]